MGDPKRILTKLVHLLSFTLDSWRKCVVILSWLLTLQVVRVNTLADWILKAKYKKETSRGSDSRKTGVIV